MRRFAAVLALLAALTSCGREDPECERLQKELTKVIYSMIETSEDPSLRGTSLGEDVSRRLNAESERILDQKQALGCD